ncbi:MAG: hypothetical protein KatS3mg051_0166 [Anaerolineae bacterium]|nr:MAG: hypothetical protein KatS3mg051_0166 [Anaerolineae bacterium]
MCWRARWDCSCSCHCWGAKSLLRRGRECAEATPRQRHALETLEAEKYRILRAIRDLDFDYDMDKLTDDAYVAQRIYLIRLALAILKRIDALEAEIATQQARVEEAIAALRAARR